MSGNVTMDCLLILTLASGLFSIATVQDFDPDQICAASGGRCDTSCEDGEISVNPSCTSGACCMKDPLPPTCGSVPVTGAGLYSSGSRIVGGSEAERHTWPWQVSLQTSSSFHFCGGSIIADRWVVTAAHCVDGGVHKVVVGEHHTGTTKPTYGESITVEKIVSHPGYDGTGDGFPNDIALLKLSQAVAFDDTKQPACVPPAGTQFDTTNYNCWISGWGQTKDTGDETKLQELPVQILPSDNCGKWGSVLNSQVCLMDKDDSTNIGGACNGDSGGPLSCQGTSGGPFWLVGATSWGVSGCTATGYPSVYTRVSEYRTWIVSTINSNSS